MNTSETILSPSTVSGLTQKWSYATSEAISSSPAVANGVVYVGSDDGKVYALDAATGAFDWSYTTGEATSSSPAVANGSSTSAPATAMCTPSRAPRLTASPGEPSRLAAAGFAARRRFAGSGRSGG